MDNTRYFRKLITETGFDVLPGEHPIIPVMIYDEPKAIRTAASLLNRGVYVIGFTYPVVRLAKPASAPRFQHSHA